jgi:hypothetical protein
MLNEQEIYYMSQDPYRNMGSGNKIDHTDHYKHY